MADLTETNQNAPRHDVFVPEDIIGELYRVLQALGNGPAGAVYRALEIERDREVVITVWVAAREEMPAEVRIAASLKPEFLREIAAVDRDGTRPLVCLVLDWADGAGTKGFLEPTHDLFAPGEFIDKKYKVLEVAGRGGHGTVYKAHDAKIGRLVAIKLCAGGDEHLRKEAQLVAAIESPYVCTVYEYVSPEAPTCGGFVFEWLAGETLEKIVRPTADSAYAIAIQIARGLAEIHSHRATTGEPILHCDIKPSNLMLVSAEGAATKIKILDLGLARAGSKARGSTFYGTPSFASPEQLRCEPLEVQSDLFSVGATMYRLIAGRLPFGKDGPVESTTLEPIRSQTSLSEDWTPLIDIVERLLARDPQDRIGSASELAEELERGREKSRPEKRVVFFDTELFLDLLRPLAEDATAADRQRQRAASERFQLAAVNEIAVSSEMVVFEVIEKLVEWEYVKRDRLNEATQGSLDELFRKRNLPTGHTWEALDDSVRWEVHKILEPKFEDAVALFQQVRFRGTPELLLRRYPVLAREGRISHRDARVVMTASTTEAHEFTTTLEKFGGDYGLELEERVVPMKIVVLDVKPGKGVDVGA